MLYLHVIDTHDDSEPVKSMFIEKQDATKLAQLISLTEKDNIIIINDIVIDNENVKKRKMKITHVFINGNEDIEYNEKLKVDKKI